MKKHLYARLALLLVLPLIIFGCEAIEDAAQFDISQPLPDVVVTVDTNTFSASATEQLVAEATVSINLDSLKEAHGLKSFEAAQFDYVRLQLSSPTDINLDWIQGIRTTVSASNIAETDIASYTRTTPAGSSIELTVPAVAVLNQVTQDNFNIKVYATASLPLPAPQIQMLLKSKLKITVQPV
ncbi:MAG TPA: hypothetical protein VK172_05285 [Lentimicrobium sp.]|jgi:hypothetical protein|nr:hypothetical protein [Lentimicrobium sp.]